MSDSKRATIVCDCCKTLNRINSKTKKQTCKQCKCNLNLPLAKLCDPVKLAKHIISSNKPIDNFDLAVLIKAIEILDRSDE